MTNISLSWAQFKFVVTNRALSIQWIDDGEKYHLYLFDGLLIACCYLPKNSSTDTIDFETNYKSIGNYPIALSTTNLSNGPITPGTAATKSNLIGGQYNSTLPTLSNAQQAGIQVDSRGRILTTTAISSIASTVAPSYSNKIKAEAQLSIIAIPSDITYTTLYTYSGSGYFVGFNVEFNNTNIVLKLVIDGNTVFDGVPIATYNSLNVTANATSRYQAGQGIVSSASVLDFSFKYPIVYTTSVTVSARLTSGGLISRNFQQGIVYIQKDT